MVKLILSSSGSGLLLLWLLAWRLSLSPAALSSLPSGCQAVEPLLVKLFHFAQLISIIIFNWTEAGIQFFCHSDYFLPFSLSQLYNLDSQNETQFKILDETYAKTLFHSIWDTIHTASFALQMCIFHISPDVQSCCLEAGDTIAVALLTLLCFQRAGDVQCTLHTKIGKKASGA